MCRYAKYRVCTGYIEEKNAGDAAENGSGGKRRPQAEERR